MSDPGAISLPGVLKNLKTNMILRSNGGLFPFIQIHLNRDALWKTCLKTKGFPLMWTK
jgi:hypothetical protein